ncbi:MAG: family 2A encapsulin nanocompartment cargo protein cysteine desulfurase [Bacteroidota bacterium]
MNTNINSNNLPNIEDLQHIANELFKALPNEFPKEISLDPSPSEHPRATKIVETLLDGLGHVEQIGLPLSNYDMIIAQAGIAPPAASPNLGGIPLGISPLGVNPLGNTPLGEIPLGGGSVSSFPFGDSSLGNFTSVGIPQTPPSIGGIGLSPFSAENYANPFGFERPEFDSGNQTDEHFHKPSSVNGGRIPASVAGSGASPSSIQHGNNINIDDPQTSFPDANLKNGNVPNSLGSGGGIHQPYLPYQSEHSSFETELQNALKAINSDFGISTSGLQPSTPSITSIDRLNGGNAFYFLGENPFAFDKKNHALPTVTSTQVKENAGLKGANFNANLIKKDFPILSETVNGKPLIWLDNAATTQKPKQVIERITYFYEHENSNIHRAAHELAARATDAYEAARQKVQHFLNAGSINEIIFVRGATEAINLVAQSWGDQNLVAGDEIIVSNLEHHANIVPWKRLADKKGLILRVIPVDDDGQILLEEYAKLLNSKTRLVSFTQVSNALGTVTPAKQIVEMAHAVGAKVLVDGAQSVSHMRVDVRYLNADFFVFSGHKVFGPTGIGVLYGKEDLLNATQPWQAGGNMIQDVTFEHIKYHNAPNRFEAGTGNIADAVGLGAAIDYVTKIGMDVIGQYEHFLLEYATHLIKQVPGIRLIGTAANKASVLSFTLEGYSNDEVGKILNQEGIAVRTGHHCAQPILRRMGVETTVRPSLAFYNTCSDVDTLVAVLHRLKSGHKN